MYERILSSTLEILKEVPTPVPTAGGLAGLVHEYRENSKIVPSSPMFQGDNYHYPMGKSYLHLGILGVAEKAAASAEKAETQHAKDLLAGISQVYRGVAEYFSRYAQAVKAAAGDDARLNRIGDNLLALSRRAPEHFDEALQLEYLMWKLRVLTWSGADIGRLDYHLRSLFEKDIASDYTTEDEVLQLLCRFWELLNENKRGDTLVNVMVGGRNADGSDSSSRLSVLMLKASQICRDTEPHINVRVHPGMRQDVREAMLQVQLMGHGQATVYNDEVVIPSLVDFGIPEEIACHYANDGCTEITLDGYSGIDFNHIDAVATFELAFNNGDWAPRTYRKTVKYYHKDDADTYYTPDAVAGFASGKVEDCESFEQFYRMFLQQYRFQVRCKANQLKRMEDDRRAGVETSLLLNGTYDFVLESGKDIQQGGFPVSWFMMFSGSIPTVADCLVAVKKLVFEEKVYTITQIKEAIRVNFEGYEQMRTRMAAAPKFGNDIDEVDLIAADIANHFCDWLAEFRKDTGFAIAPAFLGWVFAMEACGVAATPDGRRYADPIAEHYCATPGKAVNGPTAHIRSICKAKEAIARACGVCTVHVSLPKNLGQNEAQSLAILDGVVSAACQGGMNELNIALYDTEVLRKAQADPENYKDVIVRVWGYSARFVELSKEMQDHVISRVAREK